MARIRFNATYRRDNRLIQSNARWFWIGVLALLLLYLPHILTRHDFLGIPLSSNLVLGLGLNQINVALISIVAAVALNVLTGYAGLISIGNAGFFALGGGIGAFFGVQQHHPFLLVLLYAAVAGAIVGVIVGLPSLRVRGLYLLLATLAFQQIAYYLFLKYQKANFGEVGAVFSSPTLFGGWELGSDTRWYYFLLIFAVLTVVGALNLLRTRQGRALVAVRDQDIAAASAGINVGTVKVKAFALSSAVITVAGAIYTWYLGVAQADIFSIALALTFIAMIIIGGLGSVTGAVFGALLYTLLPQVITTTSSNIGADAPVIGKLLSANGPQVADIILGLLIIIIVIYKPEGLNGIWLSIKRFFVRWPYTS
ncbi:MAG: branched-chain amino acid ABC transporter permease [Nostocoides sp.]